MNKPSNSLFLLFLFVAPAMLDDATPGDENIASVREDFVTDEARAAERAYRALKEQLRNSPFILNSGAVVIDESLSSQNVDRRKLEVARAAYNEVRGAPLPEGTKVLVTEEGERDVVTFDLVLPPNTNGGEFSYQITIERETGKVLSRRVGG